MDDFVQDTGMLRKMGCTCWQQGDGKRGRRAAQPAHGILDLTTKRGAIVVLSPQPRANPEGNRRNKALYTSILQWRTATRCQ